MRWHSKFTRSRRSSQLRNDMSWVRNCGERQRSIPMNIAEGYGRKRFPEEFKRFLGFANGSCNEVSVVLSLARDLGYLEKEPYAALQNECEEVGKGINKLIQVWR